MFQQYIVYFKELFLSSIKDPSFNSLKGLGTPILLVLVLGMVILPLKPIILDFLFTFNIILALVVLLVAIYSNRPLDFGSFPAVLLIATTMRLALNVASTRVVLIDGQNGTDAAGKVIEAFGKVVIAGNYTVGFIVFIILMIINFVVITKGAGRISEVNARFTLDAMPGKQMAIDADLNAGLIDSDQAKARRSEVTREADFFGAMDGASKFVKGDAVAGILILIIGVVGGILIGVIQYDLPFAEAAEIYILLTIGDGIVAQIPGLLLSVSAALIVTRENQDGDMGEMVVGQIISNPKPTLVTGAVLLLIGVVPGMPFLFVLFAIFILILGFYNMHSQGLLIDPELLKPQGEDVAAEEAAPTDNFAVDHSAPEVSWDDVKSVDVLSIHIGHNLIQIADESVGGDLLPRIKSVRKSCSSSIGFLIPAIHIKDSQAIPVNSYNINISGVTVGSGEVLVDMLLAIDSGASFEKLEGTLVKDPAFGLDSYWIDPMEESYAASMGYTVVTPSTILATHVSEIIIRNSYKLIGYDESQQILDLLAEDAPKLIESLIPNTLSLGVFVKVLQNLLEERVWLRNLRAICKCLLEQGSISKDHSYLTSAVRIAIKDNIFQGITTENEMQVMALTRTAERFIVDQTQNTQDLLPDTSGLQRIVSAIHNESESFILNELPVVILVRGDIRRFMFESLKDKMNDFHVLSYQEIPGDKSVKIIKNINS